MINPKKEILKIIETLSYTRRGEMHSKRFDYQRRCEIESADLDTLCVDMCFIQLSLIGARARVMHMDSL